MKTHPDLEFHVGGIHDRVEIASTWDQAQEMAREYKLTQIDVVCWSREAAILWAGEYGVEEFDADPDASVQDRMVWNGSEWESQGRVA